MIKSDIKPFILELTRYYSDFLETNFHKRRIPKRSIRYRDNNNLLLGIKLPKYPGFEEKLWKIISNRFDHSRVLSINKNQYKSPLPNNLIELVKKQINEIDGNLIDDLIESASISITESATRYKNDAASAHNAAIDSIDELISKMVVQPFSNHIPDLINDNMTEVLIDPLLDTIVNSVNDLILNIEKDVKKEIMMVLDIDQVKDTVSGFFDSYYTDDIFSELIQLSDNLSIMEKQEIYLYIGEIKYENHVYPIFYIPIALQRKSRSFTIDFDSNLYINKKAINYIVERYNKAHDRKGSIKSILNRIIYINQFDDDDEFISVIETIMTDLCNYFDFPDSIELSEMSPQSYTVNDISITNYLHISMFDKSDEALINDYEEMLELLNVGDENSIAGLFGNLISDFIMEDPNTIVNDVMHEWQKFSNGEKLVSRNPIPLNTEQKQILQAIDNDKSKYILVEGPPGTGKSHTITAILFEAIRNSKSVLMLSDKKEALDVVEDKIINVIDTIRREEKFQNPILRLGKIGGTYNKILSNSSINSIRHHFQAVKSHRKDLKKDIKNKMNGLSEKINDMSNIYEQINISELQEYSKLAENFNYSGINDNIDELTYNDDGTKIIRDAYISINNLSRILIEDETGLKDLIQNRIDSTITMETFIGFLNIVSLINQIKDNRVQEYDLCNYFDHLNDNDIATLGELIRSYEELRSGFFGLFKIDEILLLFKSGKIENLDNELRNKLAYKPLEKPFTNLDKFISIFSLFTEFHEMIQKNKDARKLQIDESELIHSLITKDLSRVEKIDVDKIFLYIEQIELFGDRFPKFSKSLGLDLQNFETYYENEYSSKDEGEVNEFLRYIELEKKLTYLFQSIPDFDYPTEKNEIEKDVTNEMTEIMDGRVLSFYDNFAATAQTLKSIIRQKKKFPREEFDKLRNAFPCIIAGIRDFSEYIPLLPDLFDLVIIDEASQVSIAQALPALLRGKKIVVLGDRKQFSNVKSSLARSDTNREYSNRLKKIFHEYISTDAGKEERLKKFNIRTSILEFFEFIYNYRIMLLKHFRGYPEHISYSSKYFYSNSLQAIKIRTKPAKDVLRFTEIEHDGKLELYNKTNKLECDFIVQQLEQMKEENSKYSVGIISPHTAQTLFIRRAISDHPDRDYFNEELKLKIMTFDTCQGEERDYIYYSMVATMDHDRLWGVFIKNLESVDLEEGGMIKAQRLNVGFSRAKECMHFVLSKPISSLSSNSLKEALFHYQNVLKKSEELPGPDDTDPKSPMEKRVLQWLQQTEFYKKYSNYLQIRTQFPLSKYLKQLDKYYDHPNYTVDFLLTMEAKEGAYTNIIIEYDGFEHHFTNHSDIDISNYEQFYKSDHVEREKILESYGYNFIRLNRFNTRSNPIGYLDSQILKNVKKKVKSTEPEIVQEIKETVDRLTSGELKKCPKCEEIKPLKDFQDSNLKSGVGRYCSSCVPNRNSHKAKPFDSAGKKSLLLDNNKDLVVVKKKSKKKVSSSKECPKCGSKMVRRRSRFGSFYGCSRFPRCKGSRKI